MLVWRAVEIEVADESQALRRFHAVRTALVIVIDHVYADGRRLLVWTE